MILMLLSSVLMTATVDEVFSLRAVSDEMSTCIIYNYDKMLLPHIYLVFLPDAFLCARISFMKNSVLDFRVSIKVWSVICLIT